MLGAGAVGEEVHVLGSGDVTSLVRAAEEIGDLAGMVVDGDVAEDVGTGVAGTGTVTAAEDPLDAAAVDDDVGGAAGGAVAHVGSVAAAVDILDGVVAGVDMHGGHLAGGGGQVGCLVAAAEDLAEGEAIVAHSVDTAGAGCLVDVYEDVVLRGAVDVVAAEDGAADGGLAADRTAVVFTDVHGHDAVDQSCRTGIAEAAAVDVAAHIAALDGHGGGVAVVGTYVGQSTAAVDVGLDGGVVLHEHRRVAGHVGSVAAAEDVTVHNDLCRCSESTEDKKSAHNHAGAPA